MAKNPWIDTIVDLDQRYYLRGQGFIDWRRAGKINSFCECFKIWYLEECVTWDAWLRVYTNTNAGLFCGSAYTMGFQAGLSVCRKNFLFLSFCYFYDKANFFCKKLCNPRICASLLSTLQVDLQRTNCEPAADNTFNAKMKFTVWGYKTVRRFRSGYYLDTKQ